MDMKKIKKILEEFIKNKNINKLLIIMLIIIFVLIAFSIFKPSKDKNLNGNNETEVSGTLEETIQKEAKIKDEYEKQQKEELTSILKKIDGVGDVNVMMTFESGEVKVPAYDKDTQTSVTEETDKEGGKRLNEQKNDGSKIVMTTDEEGNEPFVIQTYKPKVQGVVVVAEGANVSRIKYNIEKAVSNLYNVSADKVNVYPMNG
ncbi:MAG: stage III sporulation protein AG [Clostridium sp.]|uniref:stage III sporulation protein AG n=1 Tax=Clostridium sp. TaxID=1506 RepID=UPI003F387333